MGRTINLQQITSLANLHSEVSLLQDDYILTHIDPEMHRELKDKRISIPDGISAPLRLDGMSWILCFKGDIDIDINLTSCHLSANTITVIPSGSIIDVKNVADGELDCYSFFISNNFLNDINFDLNVLGTLPAITSHRQGRHVMPLETKEAELLSMYFELLSENASPDAESTYSRPIARCLIAALTYEMIKMMMAKIGNVPEPTAQNTRRMSYVNQFIDLVREHHRQERSMTFYASKMFISPKYLSLIIKEITGRSASDVIDDFVVLEAKNLLRFSGKNIQQVAYELNFPNQSSFGKYFKHLTGMSPSEYQRT